jgi:hypothetical protein
MHVVPCRCLEWFSLEALQDEWAKANAKSDVHPPAEIMLSMPPNKTGQ